MNHVTIQRSRGRAGSGKQYFYVRPAGECSNRSRRVQACNLDALIEKHFPVVNYYKVNGWRIGAKNEEFALREYWRICEVDEIGKDVPVQLITAAEAAK